MKKLFILASILLLALGCSEKKPKTNFTPDEISSFKTGIFQIVVPRLEDEHMKYKEELP